MTGTRLAKQHTQTLPDQYLTYLASAACDVTSITVRTEKEKSQISAHHLEKLLTAIKKNRSINSLELGNVFNSLEFLMNSELKIRVLHSLAEIIIKNPIIHTLVLARQRFSPEEMDILIDALNHPRVQRDPALRCLDLHNSYLGDKRKIFHLLRSQANNPHIQCINLQGCLRLSDITNHGKITPFAVALVHLFIQHPVLASKIKWDRPIEHLFQKLQNQYQQTHTTHHHIQRDAKDYKEKHYSSTAIVMAQAKHLAPASPSTSPASSPHSRDERLIVNCDISYLLSRQTKTAATAGEEAAMDTTRKFGL